MKLFDSHTHIQFAAFEKDRDTVIARTRKEGVGCLVVGTQKDTSQLGVELANTYDHIYAAIGLHPVHTHRSYHDPQELGGGKGFTSRGEVFDTEHYTALAQNERTIAIGECGLDYFRISASAENATHKEQQELEIKEKQKDVFVQHIELAKAVGKPLMCHCRPSNKTQDAYEDLLEILTPHTADLSGIVIHFFVGSLKTAERFVQLGAYFTFGGVITFTNDYDDVIKAIPMKRILIETDAPYVTPVPHRGERNEPIYIIEVAKRMSELKQLSLEDTSMHILKNNEAVFGIQLT